MTQPRGADRRAGLPSIGAARQPVDRPARTVPASTSIRPNA